MNSNYLNSQISLSQSGGKVINNAVFNNSKEVNLSDITGDNKAGLSIPISPIAPKTYDYTIKEGETEEQVLFKSTLLQKIEGDIVAEAAAIKAKRNSDNRQLIFQLPERIDRFFVLVYYKCATYKPDLFKCDTVYNPSKLDWRDRTVALLTLDYLKSSPDCTLDLSDTSDVVQLIITLCLSRKVILKSDLVKHIHDTYHVRVKKPNW